MKLFRRAKPGPITALGKAILVVSPLVAAAIFYVWAEVTTLKLGYRISEANDVHHALKEENDGLRIEVAALRSPERLKHLAVERYGLEPPRTEQVLHLPEVKTALGDARAKAELGLAQRAPKRESK